MEVHAHSHTPRKKWTHYFWEFLMLFLAVFCGFLAENFREHQIENQRGKKYIQSLIKDLKNDTVEIRSVISYNIIKFRGLDTLATLLNQPILSEEDEKALYRLNSTYASNIYTLGFNDRTIRQLLNSGNMRLLKQSISDSIMNYCGQPKDEILGQEKVYEEMSRRLIFSAEDIFDNSASMKKMNSDSSFYRDIRKEKMKLITKDKNVLRKYSQMIITARSMLGNYLSMLFEMKKAGGNLLVFLENEYK